MKILIGFVAIAVLLALPELSFAGTIILSGDLNIISGIAPGGFGSHPNNNGTFFANLLGSGTAVRVFGTQSIAGLTPLNDFYNTIPGVSSSTITGRITSANLAIVDLLVVILPAKSFSASEELALKAFTASEGTLLLVGEHGQLDPGGNSRINATLSALGSSMRIMSSFDEGGIWVASRSTGQIAKRGLTKGVRRFVYGGSGVSRVSGGKALLYEKDGVTPFIAFEAVPEPSVYCLLSIAVVFGASRRRIVRQGC